MGEVGTVEFVAVARQRDMLTANMPHGLRQTVHTGAVKVIDLAFVIIDAHGADADPDTAETLDRANRSSAVQLRPANQADQEVAQPGPAILRI